MNLNLKKATMVLAVAASVGISSAQSYEQQAQAYVEKNFSNYCKGIMAWHGATLADSKIPSDKLWEMINKQWLQMGEAFEAPVYNLVITSMRAGIEVDEDYIMTQLGICAKAGLDRSIFKQFMK